MSFIYQGLDTCGFDKEVQPCKEFIHSFIKFILSIHHSSYCILFLKMLYPMFQNAVSTIPYCCIPESLYPCYHVTMYPCIPVSLYPCIPVSLYPCILVFLYPCIPQFSCVLFLPICSCRLNRF